MSKKTPAPKTEDLDTVEIERDTFGEGFEDDDIDFSTLDKGDEIVDETPEELDTEEPEEPEAPPKEKVESEKSKKTEQTADEEEEPESDVKATDDDETEEDPLENVTKIPVGRLNKEIERRKEQERINRDMQAQLEMLRRQMQQQDQQPKQEPKQQPQGKNPEEIDAELEATLKDTFDELLDGGDPAKAAKVMAKAIADARIAAAETASVKAVENVSTQSKQQQAELELQQTAERLTKEYPVLDISNKDVFNPDIFDEVIEARDGYIATGRYSYAEALDKAATVILRGYGVKPSTQATQTQEPAKPPASKTSIKEKIDAASKQPPINKGRATTEREFTPVAELPDEEFAKLSPEDLARARGDIV